MNNTRYLEVAFTAEEIIAMRAKVSQNLQELRRKKDALDSLNKQLKGDIALLDAETQLLAEKANEGKEFRNVDVKTTTDWTRSRMIVKRLDTGEVIEDRPLRPNELQKDLIEDE